MSRKTTSTPKPPIKIYQTLQSTAPLASEIHDAWRGMADRLRNLTVRQEYRGSIRSLYEYADMNLRAHGEGVLLAEMMRKNEAAREALMGGEKPIIKPEHHMPVFLVYLGVQLGGTPAIEFNDLSGKKQDGPGKILRSLPTTDLAERYGDTLNALHRMAAICYDAKKLTIANWARDKARDVELATLKFAVENGLERELRMYTAKVEHPTPDQIGDLFRHWMASNEKEYAERERQRKAAADPQSGTKDGGKPTASATPLTPTTALAAAVAGSAETAGLVPAVGTVAAKKAAAPRKRASKATPQA